MKQKRNTTLVVLLTTALSLLFAGQALAAGTTADTTISNTASVTFTIGGGTPPPVNSNTVDFAVDRKVRVVVANTDGGNIDVVPSSLDNALSFTVTNESNTNEVVDTDYFYLSASNGAGDDFDMVTPFKIYEDNGTIGVLDGADVELTGDALAYAIAVDATQEFLVVANAPDNTVITAKTLTSDVHLVATAWSNGTAAGPALPQDTDGNDPTASEVYWADDAGSLGAGSDDALDGLHSAVGTFISNWTDLSIAKTESSATGYHIPGDTVTYEIIVTNSDPSNDATTVTVSDAVPTNTTYVAGTLTCVASGTGSGGTAEYANNGTNFVDGDTTSARAVRCDSGTVEANGGTLTMTFDVTID